MSNGTIFPVTYTPNALDIRGCQSELFSRPVTLRARSGSRVLPLDGQESTAWATIDTKPSCLTLPRASPPSPEQSRPRLSRSSTSRSLARSASSVSALVRRGTNTSLSKWKGSKSTPDEPAPAPPHMLDGSHLEFEVLTFIDPLSYVPEAILNEISKTWGRGTLERLEFEFKPFDNGAVSIQAIDAEDKLARQTTVIMHEGDSGWTSPVFIYDRPGTLSMIIPDDLLDDVDGVKCSYDSEPTWLSKSEHLWKLATTFNESFTYISAASLVRLRKPDGTEAGRRVNRVADDASGLPMETRLPTDGDLELMASWTASYHKRAQELEDNLSKTRKVSIYSRNTQREALDSSRAAFHERPSDWSAMSFKGQPETFAAGAW